MLLRIQADLHTAAPRPAPAGDPAAVPPTAQHCLPVEVAVPAGNGARQHSDRHRARRAGSRRSLARLCSLSGRAAKARRPAVLSLLAAPWPWPAISTAVVGQRLRGRFTADMLRLVPSRLPRTLTAAVFGLAVAWVSPTLERFGMAYALGPPRGTYRWFQGIGLPSWGRTSH